MKWRSGFSLCPWKLNSLCSVFIYNMWYKVCTWIVFTNFQGLGGLREGIFEAGDMWSETSSYWNRRRCSCWGGTQPWRRCNCWGLRKPDVGTDAGEVRNPGVGATAGGCANPTSVQMLVRYATLASVELPGRYATCERWRLRSANF